MMTIQTPQPTTAAVSHSQWYIQERPETFIEGRRFGALELANIVQSAGSFPDPAFDEWRLQFTIGADVSAQFNFGNGRFSASSTIGQLLLSPADAHCDYDIHGDHNIIALTIPKCASLEIIEDLCPKFSGDFGALHTCVWRDNDLRDLALLVWRAARGDALAPVLDTQEVHFELLTRLMRNARQKIRRDAQRKLQPHTLRRVLDYISENLSADLSVPVLAEVAGVSPYHFARSFRADTAESPAKFVMRQRISKAVRLLKDTTNPLTRIAFDCGFSSQPRFNEAFRRYIGCTPSVFRHEVGLPGKKT